LKIFYLADLLSQKGWHLNIIQFPEAIHIACTLLTIRGVDDLIRDIKESVELMVKDPNSGNGEVAAIYGTAASVPDCGIIKDVCRGFLDALTLMPEVVAEK
jgi:sphinganine-1-phosphate aldolase